MSRQSSGFHEGLQPRLADRFRVVQARWRPNRACCPRQSDALEENASGFNWRSSTELINWRAFAGGTNVVARPNTSQPHNPAGRIESSRCRRSDDVSRACRFLPGERTQEKALSE
jgi:hypothetical protein